MLKLNFIRYNILIVDVDNVEFYFSRNIKQKLLEQKIFLFELVSYWNKSSKENKLFLLLLLNVIVFAINKMEFAEKNALFIAIERKRIPIARAKSKCMLFYLISILLMPLISLKKSKNKVMTKETYPYFL